MMGRITDKVASDIGRSNTQWVDDTFRGDEAKGCLHVELAIFQVNSSARRILRSAYKSTKTLSRQGCVEKCVLIYSNMAGEFASCRPASVVPPHFASYRRRSPDLLLLVIFTQSLRLVPWNC